jgi:hypothetical protein
MREIGTNPLLLTLFLYVVSEAGLQVPIEIRSKRDLLSRTLEIWARREIVRLRGLTGETQHESDLLLQAWRVAAWLLYRARFTPAPPIKLEHLLANINTVVPEADGICESEAFGGLLDIRTHTNEVMGFLHEQLLEELVAELLCKGMQNSSCPFPGSLEVAVRWEINQLIRSMWAEAEPQALKDTLANIVRAFEASLADNAPASVLRRNQAAYYMGRLGIREGAGELRSADAKETNPFVKLSISFSLMKNLQFDVEDAFVRRLKDDPDWDAVNRGYHLFYYRDWHIPNPQPPYSDPGTIPWDNTARALLRHIESNSIDHVAIRRVELFTIRRFIETRRAKGPLTPAVIAKIEAAVNATTRAQYPDLPAGFHNQLLAEFTDLKTVWVSVQ